MLYGFNQTHARILKRVARREGLRAVVGTTVRYLRPMPDEPTEVIGEITTLVTAYVASTKTLGTGKLTVYSKNSSNVLTSDGNPSIDVYSLNPFIVPTGVILRARLVTGVGLVIDDIPLVYGTTSTTHNKNASQDVNILTGTEGSESDTTQDAASVRNQWVNIGSGKRVLVGHIMGHRKYLVTAECPLT
jgi:hypothetical protein